MNTSRGMQSTAEHQLGVGDVIGRYRIVGRIGEGRSGPLYVAEQKGAEHRVAEQRVPEAVAGAPGGASSLGSHSASKTVRLSCVRPDICHSPRFRERFFDAASVAARCEHPNVINVLEMDELHGRYFVCMEYLPGESLAAI